MSNHDTLLTEFVSITNVDEERARFYLESSAWQLEVALASFYENDGISGTPPDEDTAPISMEESPTSPAAVKVTASQPKSRTDPNSRIATVHSLNSSSSDEEGQAFYAGGSEHSGQQVLGPSKKKDFVAEMFKSVQEHGAEVVEPRGSSDKPRAFLGTGYKLGQTSNDTEVVAGASRRPSHTEMVLKLWREGFSINNGELREYTDPQNREFLEYVKRGEIPPELIREANGSEVHLNMEDHRHEEFVMMKTKLQPFSGRGHTLGSPAPAAVGAPGDKSEDKEANEKQAKKNLNVNKEEPTTNVQIRLADGSRLLGEFNHNHTVGDLHHYIRAARPQYENLDFALLTTFPNRELSENSQTLKDAGLLNAAVMQRLK